MYGITSQIRRAGVSIPANIAEGQARNTKGEFLQFIGIARGSLAELVTLLEISRGLTYLPSPDAEELLSGCGEVGRLLTGLKNQFTRVTNILGGRSPGGLQALLGADGLRWARGGKLRTEDTEGTRGPWWREFAGISVVRWAGRWQTSAVRLGVESRSRARARPNFSCHGQLCGRCRVRRRAERVSRPAGRRTAAGGSWWSRSARPDRSARPAGQVMRHHLIASQAPLAAKRPDGRSTPRRTSGLEWRSHLGVAAVVGLQLQGFPVPVGDEAVKAVGGEEGQLGTGRGLDPPDDEPHRCGIGLKGVLVSATSAAPSIQ